MKWVHADAGERGIPTASRSLMRAAACWLVGLVGCYDPQIECPFDRCHAVPAGSLTEGGALIDASATAGDAKTPDGSTGSPPDAAIPPPTCAPGCAGTCDDGVCVISCIGDDACEQEVLCPLTGPCRVVCSGKKACNQGVRCGLGRCTVTCNGNDACHKRVNCGASCACDVTCGPDACKDDALCPQVWCEAGDGCTSAPNACHSC